MFASIFTFITLSQDFFVGFTTAIISILCALLYGRCKRKPSSAADHFNNIAQPGYHLRRWKTFPPPVPNTWYHIMDSDEVKPDGKVHYIRAIGQNFAIWRTKVGEPIVMHAFCPHMGANLGVGGKISLKDDCIKCPFHEWTFDKNGNLVDIPYIKDKQKMQRIKCKPISKYIAKDFAGLLCVYFHADHDQEDEPEFDLPAFVSEELCTTQWHCHTKIDLGVLPLSPVDWVDQAGDHGHFATLHSHFLVPYTRYQLPSWFNQLIGISHECTTVIGNKWNDKLHGKKTEYYGQDCKSYIYFLDKAGIIWKGKVVEGSKSLTKELYLGPAMMIFHIPLGSMGVGDIKLFVTTTPTLDADGQLSGSVMRVRVWLSDYSFKLRFIAWFIVGVATSQLLSDIDIMCNRIRKRTPLVTKGCGPYSIVNTWLKNFYSESSDKVGKSLLDDW